LSDANPRTLLLIPSYTKRGIDALPSYLRADIADDSLAEADRHPLVRAARRAGVDVALATILEAMAMGKAVIVTRTIGQRDVIQPNVNGLYVPRMSEVVREVGKRHAGASGRRT
jgi:glycosyltransferase involved in cell wall biosynthesis